MCHACLIRVTWKWLIHGHYFAADYYLGKANEDLLEHSTFSLEIKDENKKKYKEESLSVVSKVHELPGGGGGAGC